MEILTALGLAVALCLALWVPYFIINTRRGKARGHTWFTWWKPRGHSDIGPDIGGNPQRLQEKTRRAGPDYSLGRFLDPFPKSFGVGIRAPFASSLPTVTPTNFPGVWVQSRLRPCITLAGHRAA